VGSWEDASIALQGKRASPEILRGRGGRIKTKGDRGLRVLGIDFGERRIGLAISDPEGRWAMPLATLERTTDRRAAYEIAALVRREDVRALVVGEPRHPETGAPHSRSRSLAWRISQKSLRRDRFSKRVDEAMEEETRSRRG